MDRIAIIDGIRTPFCKMGTAFNGMAAQDLARIAVRELLDRTAIDPAHIDEVIFGCVAQPPEAANIARVIALMSGIPATTPAYTVHRNCASGMESVINAAMRLQLGEGRCCLAGGAESMSNIPLYAGKALQDRFWQLQRAKTWQAKLGVLKGFRFKELVPQVGLQMGLTDPVCGLNMGQTAEVLAKEFGISRREQDEFALTSHRRAVASREHLREEIVPVLPGPDYKDGVEHDNGPREQQTYEALAKLRPYFDRRSGTVTAGNASQVTDGAAALLVMTESRAVELGFQPMGFIRAHAYAGVEPNRMGIGPAHAIPRALRKAGMTLKDIPAVEINEAFAAQVIACLRALESKDFAAKFGYDGLTGTIDPEILNVNGGAIALGHPVGTTGARLILTMLRHMHRAQLPVGLVSLCVGGGQGMAIILER